MPGPPAPRLRPARDTDGLVEVDVRRTVPPLPSGFAASNGQGWLVVCDFDGTIAQADVTDLLLERFALREWEALESEWKAGRLSARDCMSRQVELLRVAPDALDDAAAAVPIDPAFRDFVADCRTRRFDVVVISDGLDRPIRRILAAQGLDDVPLFANRLISAGADRWRLEPATPAGGCSAGSLCCKCSVSATLAGGQRRLLIGDGRSDYCLADEADLVFARHLLLERSRARELPVLDCPDFMTARALLARLPAAAWPVAAPAPAHTPDNLHLHG